VTSSLQRDEVHIAGDDRRIYVDLDDEWMGLSVSTVTGYRDDPEKDEAIKGWMETFNGQYGQQWTFPHYEEQRTYKSYRGTLGHYIILSELGDVPKGSEEREAEHALKNWAEERPAKTMDGVTMQRGADDHAYDGEQAWSKCMRELNWATNEFVEVAQILNISSESTIATEDYLRHDDPNYSGQSDLLFVDDDNVVTLLDLKFSSAIRHDHHLQLAAYRHAINADDRYPEVERVMDLRLYPDKEELSVSVNDLDDETHEALTAYGVAVDVWDDGTLDALTDEFLGLIDGASEDWLDKVSYSEMVTRLGGRA